MHPLIHRSLDPSTDYILTSESKVPLSPSGRRCVSSLSLSPLLHSFSLPQMAHTFSSEPNIIGYELLNEPFVASRTSIGVPYNLWRRSRTETKYLQPLYDRLSLAIRKIDPRTLIWYEPATGGGSDAGKGFRSTPGGEDAKSVMSFHSYGPNVVDTQSIEQAVELRWEQVNKLGGGLAVSFFLLFFHFGNCGVVY